MAAIRSKVEKMNQNREQGTLHHHQCIDELTLHLRKTQIKQTTADETKLVSPTRSETPTSFVTVIEVKDPSPIQTAISTSQTTTSISIADQQSEIKEENQLPTIEKTDDRNTSPVQNVEIRRKIPPRCDFYTTIHSKFVLFYVSYKTQFVFVLVIQATTEGCSTCWANCRRSSHDH